MSTVDRKTGHVQSVDRAISVLEFLSRNGLSGVTEIASLLDIHKSTAYRLIATLEARGLVEQDIESEKYQLGFGLISLASAVTAEFDLLQLARPVCDQLSADTDETVTLTVMEGDEPIVLHQSVSSTSILTADWTGSDTPIHCTAAGKIFMAYMPSRRLKRLLGRDLERYTPYTLVDRDTICAQIDAIKADGYAFTIEELELGLTAVGAPVFAVDGSVAAVISVSSPTVRLPAEEVPAMGKRVNQAAAEISRKIGYHPDLRPEET